MLAEFSVIPMHGAQISADVARAIEILEEEGLEYRLGPMSTSIEGDWDRVFSAIRRCHDAVASAAENHRVITSILIDDRREGAHHLNEAVTRVEEHLGRRARQ